MLKNKYITYSLFILWWIYLIYIWYLSLNILYLILFAFILSLSIENLILFLTKYIWRTLSIIITYIFLLLLIIWWLFLIWPFLFNQITLTLNYLIEYLKYVQTITQDVWFKWFIENSNIPINIKNYLIINSSIFSNIIVNNLPWLISTLSNSVVNIWNIIISTTNYILKAIVNFSIVISLSIFFSLEKKALLWVIRKLCWFDIIKLIYNLYDSLWWWLKSQLILCMFFWLNIYFGLNILKVFWLIVNNSFQLSLISWLSEFIPYVWNIFWLWWIILQLWLDNGLYWIVAWSIVFFSIQRIQNNILIPYVLHKTLWINPLLIILVLLLSWSIFGFIWIIFSIPISIVITTLYDNYKK